MLDFNSVLFDLDYFLFLFSQRLLLNFYGNCQKRNLTLISFNISVLEGNISMHTYVVFILVWPWHAFLRNSLNRQKTDKQQSNPITVQLLHCKEPSPKNSKLNLFKANIINLYSKQQLNYSQTTLQNFRFERIQTNSYRFKWKFVCKRDGNGRVTSESAESLSLFHQLHRERQLQRLATDGDLGLES